MKKLFSVLCFALVVIFASDIVNAQCKCGGYTYEKDNSRKSRYKTAYEEFQDSTSVFVGKVIEVKKVKTKSAYKDDYNYKVKFKVEKSWKKNTPNEIVITQGGGCILSFKEGEEHLVYASLSKKDLWVAFCSRTRELIYAEEDLKEFEEKGEKPQDIVEKTKPKQ